MTLFATLMGSLLLAPAFGALLLSHGYDGLAAAWQPAALGCTVCTRERQAAQAALVAGWVAVLTAIVLLVSLSLRARHAPLAAATLDATAHVLQGLPATYLLLPLYVAVASGAVLVSNPYPNPHPHPHQVTTRITRPTRATSTRRVPCATSPSPLASETPTR